MAEHAASMMRQPGWMPLRPGLRLQRKCACGTHTPGGGECAECIKKKKAGVQTKLQVNEPGDSYEREADRVADLVTAAPARLATSDALPRIQRYPEQSTGPSDAAPAGVEQVLATSGRPLNPMLRQDMEQRLGHDFSQVRIHDGGQAAESAQSMRAQAYTAGNHIVFNTGRFEPGTRAGRHLLTHELVHVVQQDGAARRQASIQRKPVKEEQKEDCRIRSPKAYVFFEIMRQFNDPTDSDPRVLKRARCLKQAFGLLSADDAVDFAQQIMEKKGIYPYYMKLHHATRLALAEILGATLARKDTATYEARLLAGDVFIPADSKEVPAPTISVSVQGKGVDVTLKDPLFALGKATLLGAQECDKYSVGFTQFLIEEEFVSEYFLPIDGSYVVIDNGATLTQHLPCYDVHNTGDVWSYSTKLDCAAKGAIKPLQDQWVVFHDAPNTPFADAGGTDILPSAFKHRDKFVTVFYATLPNGKVHFFSWFDWSMAYCNTFAHNVDGRKKLASLPTDPAAHQVVINTPNQGAPPAPLAGMAGKPAPKYCNDLARHTPSKSEIRKKPSVTCP